MAKIEGFEIEWIARWGKNGRKYVWINPSQKKVDEITKKYRVSEFASNGAWLNT